MGDLTRTQQSQPVQITDDSAQLAALASTAPVGTEVGLIVRNVPSGTQPVSGTITAVAGTGTYTTTPTGTQAVSYGSGTFIVQDTADGPVAAGAAAAKSTLGGMVYNTSVPAPTNGQQLALQSDGAGNLVVNVKTPITVGGTVFTLDSADGGAGGGSPGSAAGSSNLAGMVYNTAAPAPTNGQQLGLQSDSAGNLKVAGSLTTTPSGTQVVAYGSGTFLTQDVADGPVAPGAAAAKSTLGGMVYNTSNPAPTNGQQLALQSDSAGNLEVNVKNTVFTVDNVDGGGSGGAPGAAAGSSSLAGMVYNTAAPAPTNGQQLALQSDSAGNLKVAGSLTTTPSGTQTVAYGAGTFPVSGTITNVPSGTQTTTPTGTQAVSYGSGTFIVQDTADGPVAPGAAAAKSTLGGMVYNTVAPSLTDGQQVAFQSDSVGRFKVSVNNTVATLDATAGGISGGPGSCAGVSGLVGMAYLTAAPSPTNGQQLALQSDSSGNLKVAGSLTSIPSGTQTVAYGSGTFPVSGTITNVPSGTQTTTPTGTQAVSYGSGTFLTQDASDGAGPAPGAAAAKSSLGGLVYNTAAPVATNGQQLALQGDVNGNLKVAGSLTSVPSGTQTVAYGSGTFPVSGTITNVPSGTQTVAVSGSMIVVQTTAANLTSTVVGTITSVPSGTQTTTPTGTQAVSYGSGTFLTQDAGDGPVAPGAAAAKSMLGGLVYNTAAPTATNGQQLALQGDVNGNLKVVLAGSITQPISGTVTAVQSGTYTVAGTVTNVPSGTQTVTGTVVASAGALADSASGNSTITTTAQGTTAFAIAGYDGIAAIITDTVTATLAPQFSMDGGTTWSSASFMNSAGLLVATTTVIGNFGIISVPGGTSHVRLLSSGTWNSGTATVSFRATVKSLAVQVQGVNGGQAVGVSVTNTAGQIMTTAPAGTELAVVTRNIPSGTQTTVPTGTLAVAGDVANAVSNSGNPLQMGGRVAAAQVTALTDAQRVSAMFDKVGRQVTTAWPRDLIVTSSISTTTTAAITVFAAQSAGIFVDITNLVISNGVASAQTVTLGTGSAVYKFVIPASSNINLAFYPPLIQPTAASAWTATVTPSGTLGVFFTGVGIATKG